MGCWDHKTVKEIFDILRTQAAAKFGEELAKAPPGPRGRDKAWAAVDKWVMGALAKIEFHDHPEVRDAGD